MSNVVHILLLIAGLAVVMRLDRRQNAFLKMKEPGERILPEKSETKS